MEGLKPRPCRPTPVSSFMCARVAARGSGQRRAIAACFAPMDRYRARLCRRSVRPRPILPCVVRTGTVVDSSARPSRDWLASPRASTLAWWIPYATLIAALVVSAPIRAVVWTVALIWMGTACILNARRCNRTHCRFSGPHYLAMIMPVLALGSGMISAGIYGWIALGILILGGSKLIWWATERAWGRFS